MPSALILWCSKVIPGKEYCQISRLRTYIVFTALFLSSFTVLAGGIKELIVSIPVTSPKRGAVLVDSHIHAPACRHRASLLDILPGDSASFLSPSDVPSALITPSTLEEITGQPIKTASRQKNKRPAKKDKLKAKLSRTCKSYGATALTHAKILPHNLECCMSSVVDSTPSELNGYLPGDPVPSLTAPATESGIYSGAADELQTPDSTSIIDHEETSLIPPSLCKALLPSLLPSLLAHFSSVEHQKGTVPAPLNNLSKPSGFASLKLETVSADSSPFPALTPASKQELMEFSPCMKRLAETVRQDQNPLRKLGELYYFLRSLPDETESYQAGNHSLVIKRLDAPGHVAKIARCNTRDAHRFEQELQLYQYIQKPGMELLALNSCPLLKAFSFAGRPVLVMEQIGFIADQQLIVMKDRSLFERLDFALTWLWRFCDVYRLFLEHGILLADRHSGNIGFNETRLPPMPELDFPGATLRIPVMLDLDPYWKDDTETTLRLSLPTWIPVAMDLLERAFHPGEIGGERRDIHNHLRKLAIPAKQIQAECQTEQSQGVENLASQSITFWLGSQEKSPLKDEAKQWLPQLFTLSGALHDKARTVREWTEVLQTETERIITTLSQWKACSRFELMADCYRAAPVAPLTLNQNMQEENASQLQIYSQAVLARTHADIKCGQCSRCFRSLNEYKSHHQHHEEGRLKVCVVCDGEYVYLKPHMRTHTGEKPFDCKHCGRGFAEQSKLKRHLHTHASVKLFPCTYRNCDKRFSTQQHMKYHLYTHTGEKPFKCDYTGCTKGFIHNFDLTKHRRTHTGEKAFKCEYCNYRTIYSNDLNKHRRTHTGEKPFPCTYQNCDKRFAIKHNMKDHLRTHTGESPFKCEVCGKEFSRSNSRKRHQKKCREKQQS